MNIEVQARGDGSLELVAPDKGRIVTLSRSQLSILHLLTRTSRTMPLPQTVLFERLNQGLVRQRIRAHMKTFKTVEIYRDDLVKEVTYLQKLGLVAPAARRPLLETWAMLPYTPVKLTGQGKLFLEWLKTKWTGWPAYTRQFPL